MKALISYVEASFDCEVGPETAFFDQGDQRRVYVSYVGRGDTKSELTKWMREIFYKLIIVGGVKLYWRMTD